MYSIQQVMCDCDRNRTWKETPEFQDVDLGALPMAALTSPEDVASWFHLRKAVRHGFQWAAYAVPSSEIRRASNQLIFDRVKARRLGVIPLQVREASRFRLHEGTAVMPNIDDIS